MRLGTLDAAAVAGHRGPSSIATFVAAAPVLPGRGIQSEGYVVAIAAVMEAPAILLAHWLVMRGGSRTDVDDSLLREILLDGSIVLLVGAFAIGWITGEDGLKEIEALTVGPFKGAICRFLQDMGLIAVRRQRGQSRGPRLRSGCARHGA